MNRGVPCSNHERHEMHETDFGFLMFFAVHVTGPPSVGSPVFRRDSVLRWMSCLYRNTPFGHCAAIKEADLIQSSVEDPPQAAASLNRQIALFAAARIVLNTMHRMVYPFLPVFGRGLGVGLPALSLALTVRAVAGAIGALFASLADSWGQKTGMVFGTLLFIAGMVLVAGWPVFPSFVIAIVLAVLGKYVFDPAMQAYLGDRVPYRRRGLVIATTEISWSFSFIFGMPLIGLLIGKWGWSAPFGFLALLAMATAGIVVWMLPADPVRSPGRPGPGVKLRGVARSTPALAALATALLASAANEVINLIFGVWMEQSFGLKVATLGAASAVIGLSELGGETLAAGLTDRMGKQRAIRCGLILNCGAAVLLPLLGIHVGGALTGLFLLFLTFEFTMVSLIPLMTEILPDSRATLMAANVAAMSLGRALGALIAPALYGSGIAACAFTVAFLNLGALAALRRIRIVTE